MGFELFGYQFFDLSAPVGYGEAFITIIIVCVLSFGLFLWAKYNAPK